jgi:hypothetical protein
MPTDSTITFFGPIGPNGCCFFDDWNSFLATNGITTTGGGFGGSNYFAPNTGSSVSPYGIKIMAHYTSFTFAEPVYAVGATFLSMQDANFHTGVQTVTAYDQFGNVIGLS